MPHPYTDFEETPLWRAVDSALGELQANRDLEVTTARPYVVGYLCQQLASAGVVTAGPDGSATSGQQPNVR